MNTAWYRSIRRTFVQHLHYQDITATADEINDALHNALYRFLRNRTHIRTASHGAAAWILVTARRDLLSARRRSTTQRLEYLCDAHKLVSYNYADHLASTMLIQAITKCLSPKLNDVFQLSMDGYTRAEIAHDLNLLIETVNKRLERAKTQVRTHLERDVILRDRVARFLHERSRVESNRRKGCGAECPRNGYLNPL